MEQKPAIALIRVSTHKQDLSQEYQKERIDEYAAKNNFFIVEHLVDIKSGKDTDREGLTKALHLLSTYKTLIIYKLDRLTRSVVDLGKIIDIFNKHSFDLISITENINTKTPHGRLILNILSSVSQWEREAISERTKEALATLKRRGIQTGQPPFGYKRDKETKIFVLNPQESELFSYILHLYNEGFILTSITRILEKENLINPRSDMPFSLQAITLSIKYYEQQNKESVVSPTKILHYPHIRKLYKAKYEVTRDYPKYLNLIPSMREIPLKRIIRKPQISILNENKNQISSSDNKPQLKPQKKLKHDTAYFMEDDLLKYLNPFLP